jgi:hypothetical protein
MAVVKYYVDEQCAMELNINIDVGGTVEDIHARIKQSAPIQFLEKEHYRITHLDNASTLQSSVSEILDVEFFDEIISETPVEVVP